MTNPSSKVSLQKISRERVSRIPDKSRKTLLSESLLHTSSTFFIWKSTTLKLTKYILLRCTPSSKISNVRFWFSKPAVVRFLSLSCPKSRFKTKINLNLLVLKFWKSSMLPFENTCHAFEIGKFLPKYIPAHHSSRVWTRCVFSQITREVKNKINSSAKNLPRDHFFFYKGKNAILTLTKK